MIYKVEAIIAICCAATSFALDRALLSDQIQQISEPGPGFEPFDLLRFCVYN
jgi:hypothetical protein